MNYFSFSYGEGIAISFGDFLHALQFSGATSIVFGAFSYVMHSGIIIAASLILRNWWYRKRVVCFWITGVAVLLFLVGRGYHRSISAASLERAGETGAHIREFWISPPSFGFLIAVAAGGLVSSLPIARPGRRYWLSQGMCPRCHYDLKGNVKVGCPECGWNRPDRVGQTPPRGKEEA